MHSLINLVTGSDHKLREWQRLFPEHIALARVNLDLDEIQSLDNRQIVEHKVKQAYQLVKKPVLVEDVSAGIDALGGLPGPFIKFFEKQLGNDALYQLASTGAPATIICTIGYYDGVQLVIGQGVLHGSVVAARGKEGFGFDSVFVPNGQQQTFAEMGSDKKDSLSHRALAIKDMIPKLEQL